MDFKGSLLISDHGSRCNLGCSSNSSKRKKGLRFFSIAFHVLVNHRRLIFFSFGINVCASANALFVDVSCYKEDPSRITLLAW